MLCSGDDTIRTPHGTHAPTNAHAPSLSHPLPRCRCGSRRKVTPCLGNVVCWRLVPQRCCRDMELPYCGYHVGGPLAYDPPMPRHQPHQPRGTVSARTRRWACPAHLRGSHDLRPPIAMGWCRTNRGGLSTPSAVNIFQIKGKTMLTSPGSASVLPGDIGNDWVQICTRYRWRPPPGSPLRLPGELQVSGGMGSARTHKGARTTGVVLTL
jgi:hypothetical protein